MSLLRRYLGLNRHRLLAFSLARSLHEGQWASDRGTDELDAWFREYLRLNRDLGAGAIVPDTWRYGLDRLFAELRLADLLQRTAESEDCFIFATKLIRLDETKPFQARINVDLRNAIDVGAGAIRAPKISGKLAEMRYGARP